MKAKRASVTRAELLRLQRNSKRYVFLREASLLASYLDEARIDELMRKFYERRRKRKEQACKTCGKQQLHWEVRADADWEYRLVNRRGTIHKCITSKFQPRIKKNGNEKV